MGRGGMVAIGIATIVVVGAILVFGGMSLLLSYWPPKGRTSQGSRAMEKALVAPPPEVRMPDAEAAFVSTVQSYVDRCTAAHPWQIDDVQPVLVAAAAGPTAEDINKGFMTQDAVPVTVPPPGDNVNVSEQLLVGK